MATREALLADIARVEAARGNPVSEAYFDREWGGIDSYLDSQKSRLAALGTQEGVYREDVPVSRGLDDIDIITGAPPVYREGVQYDDVGFSPAGIIGGVGDLFAGLGTAARGFGGLLTEWVPWVLAIALIYAVGTLLDIKLKVGVGK